MQRFSFRFSREAQWTLEINPQAPVSIFSIKTYLEKRGIWLIDIPIIWYIIYILFDNRDYWWTNFSLAFRFARHNLLSNVWIAHDGRQLVDQSLPIGLSLRSRFLVDQSRCLKLSPRSRKIILIYQCWLWNFLISTVKLRYFSKTDLNPGEKGCFRWTNYD